MAQLPSRVLALSAQQVDPLSWFTGPFVPLGAGLISLLFGGTVVITGWSGYGMPWLQVFALALAVASTLVVHLATRPMRLPLSWGVGAAALGIAVAAVAFSAVGYSSATLAIEHWWASLGLALTIVSLGPYLAPRALVPLGVTAAGVAVTATMLIGGVGDDTWGPVSTAIIIAMPALLAVASMTTFSYSVVSTMLPMLESPSRIMVAGRAVRDEAAERVERMVLAHLTARAAPFIVGVAESRRVSPHDRALAGQLARRLRDDLVTQSSVSWLDSIADRSRLVVVDPERLARRMNNAQRTAVLGLLQAVLDTPGTDSNSLMVELRRAPDGATAAALSLDIALPEGRRIMHLAPYYLTLTTVVDDLLVGRSSISFRMAGDDRRS